MLARVVNHAVGGPPGSGTATASFADSYVFMIYGRMGNGLLGLTPLGIGMFHRIRKTKCKGALLSVIGRWKDRTDLPDTDRYIRGLRKSKRLARLI